MSSEGERNICRHSSALNLNQAWDRLSLEIAVHIFEFLPTKDRFNMSLTCKFWLAAFRHPGSWRNSNFEYTGNRASNTHIPVEVLSSLQFVTIDCKVSKFTQSIHKMQRLHRFVQSLNVCRKTTLKRMDILDMTASGVMNTDLLNELVTLIARQTNLSRLSLSKARLNLETAFQLLTAAGQNSAHCLKYLDVLNLCALTSPLDDQLFFTAIFSRFTNLTELSITCGFMSDDLLSHLSGTLQRIKVFIYWNDLAWFVIKPTYTNNGWNVLVSKCTGLKAEYHIDDYMGYMDRSPSLVFVPKIPLATFQWGSRGGDPNIIVPCFDQIINTFKNGLEHLHVDFGFNVLSERDVVAVVERCPLLKTFVIDRQPAQEVEGTLAQRRKNKQVVE